MTTNSIDTQVVSQMSSALILPVTKFNFLVSLCIERKSCAFLHRSVVEFSLKSRDKNQ
jgi:hypothetical protein